MVAGLPALHKPLNAIVSTTVAQLLQALVETMGRTAARPRQLCLQFEPLRQLCLELPKLGRDRLYTCIAGFLNRLQMPAYRRPRDSHLPGDGGNRLLLDQMAPADFVNDVHVKHSRYLRRNTGWLHSGVETIGRCFHPESGKFCTLFDTQHPPRRIAPRQASPLRNIQGATAPSRKTRGNAFERRASSS